MMTRKRFIKLMMAQGYTRNQCERMANGVVKTGYSYRETYNLAMGFHSLWPKVYPGLEKLAEKLREFFHWLFESVRKTTEAFVNVVNNAFSDLEKGD